jgi:hypothetical protein
LMVFEVLPGVRFNMMVSFYTGKIPGSGHPSRTGNNST